MYARIGFTGEAYEVAAEFYGILRKKGYVCEVRTRAGECFDATIMSLSIGDDGQYKLVMETADDWDNPERVIRTFDAYDDVESLVVY